ncbi:MAG: P22 phage major capsid protein family protein [Geminicoccaceae bacterium]
MANTLLTPTMITREALRILHQKLNFVGNINRQYDDRFAVSGAKIGDTLQIRLPNQYTVRTGRTIDVQDTVETKVDLVVSTQKGVDMAFTSVDLTLDLDDFAERILEPAMAVLAAHIENDSMSMYKDVYNEVSDVGTSITSADVLNIAKKLTDNLSPVSMRCLNMNTQDNVDLVEALKGLFNDPAKISKNYREGMIANDFLGFQTVYQNTLWPIHTTGTDDGTGDYLCNDATAQTGAALTVDTGAGTFKKGDIIAVDGVFRVHPETKVSTGALQKFVVTSDVAASATSIPISPSIVASGAKQNVSNGAANNEEIFKRESDDSTAIGNAADYNISMGFHKDAFTFATADLVMPRGVDFAAREVYDGISMRIVRDYDINNDNLPCRIDVLYGYKTVRPELACRGGFN